MFPVATVLCARRGAAVVIHNMEARNTMNGNTFPNTVGRFEGILSPQGVTGFFFAAYTPQSAQLNKYRKFGCKCGATDRHSTPNVVALRGGGPTRRPCFRCKPSGRSCVRSAGVAREPYVQACGRNSVLYFPARDCALAKNWACAAASSGGGALVRVATGMPISAKKSSRPGGEQRHRSRAGRSDLLRNWCGAFEGM